MLVELPVPKSLRLIFQRNGSPQSVRKGVILFREGEKASGVYLVATGKVRLWMNVKSGKALKMKEVGPGGLLGLPATLSETRYSLTAIAAAPSQVIFMTRGPLVEFMRREPEAALELLSNLSSDLRDLRKKMAQQN